MVQVQSIDISGLEFMINGLQNALIGTGGDASEIVKDESKLLAKEISNRVGPLDREKTRARIRKSVESKFLALGSDENSQFDAKGGNGNETIKWYRCDSKFLYGAARDSDMRKASGETLANLYYASKTIQGRKRIVVDFNPARPNQKIAITSKIITNKSARNRAVAIVQQAIGKLKASWLATAKSLDSSIVGPQWIERHIKGDRTSKSITDKTSLQNPQSPAVTFGSRAIGVGKFSRLVAFAVKVRTQKVAARIDLVLSGYSKDAAAGIKIRRHAKGTSHEH